MNPWICAGLIAFAGAVGGFVNALITNNGCTPPSHRGSLVSWRIFDDSFGSFAAFASWAFYGSGVSIDVADPSARPHLQMPALAGAFLVGVVGAKWITNEAEKGLLKESVNLAATKDITKGKSEEIVSGSPLEVLTNVTQA